MIAPYATVLAAQFMPREAVDNLERLKAIGALGRYGFYDAVDFTPQRVPEGTDHAVVYNYMAHHQGMSIVAVANAIFEGRMRDRFHSDPVIEAAELLLQEKAPRDIPVATVRTEADERVKVEAVEPEPGHAARRSTRRTALRSTSLMSNGRYSVMVTATGSGYSRWNELAVTRWQADPTEDRLGTYHLPARHRDRRLVVGDGRAEAGARTRAAQTLFCDDKASFIKTVGTLRSEVECIVVSEGNGEAGASRIINDGDDRPPYRGDVLRRAGAGAGSRRQRPSGLLQDVRRDRDRAERQRRSSRSGASARQTSPTSRWRISSPIRPASARDTRGRDRPPRLHRPRPHASPTPPPSIAAPGLAATHGFTLDPVAVAAPPRPRAGQQEGLADLLDRRRRRPRRGRGGRSAGSTIRESFRAPGDARLDALARCRRAIWASASPMPPTSRSWRAT